MNKEFITYTKSTPSQKCVDADVLAEMLEIPKQVLCWTIEHESQLTAQEDYFRIGRQNAQQINFKALIYALDKFCENYNKKLEILRRYIGEPRKSEENYKVKYEELKAVHEELIKNIKTSINIALTAAPAINDTSNENTISADTTPQKMKSVYKRNSDLLPALSENEKKWQKNIVGLTRKAAELTNGRPANLMQQIYRKITAKYGIVFDQEKKELKEQYNIDIDAHMSTLYVVTKSEQLRSIYQAIVSDIINNEKEKENNKNA